MEELILERVTTDEETLQKVKKKKKSVSSISRSLNKLEDKIQEALKFIESYLGEKKEEFRLVTKEEELKEYVDRCLENGFVSIDTETTGLDTYNDKIVGFSLFTPNQKAIYVPLRHTDIDGNILPNQMNIDFAKEEMKRLKEVKTVWFNADFDVRMFRHDFGVYFTPYFDCYIAARILNENEDGNGLKALHAKYVLNGKEDEFSFGEIFGKIPFQYIPPRIAYLYAAKDALVTYELYAYQMPYLTAGTEENERYELRGVADVFWGIEMPIVTHIADMEDTGLGLDLDYQKKLSVEYNEALEKAEEEFYNLLTKYTRNVYSISSPKQLAELFYDELQLLEPVYDKVSGKMKRTVDVETLKNLNHPLAKSILKYRENQKLISTYVDKMPTIMDKDGKVRTNFNQVGTDTGRFSSSGKFNAQNIPSHNTNIRKMFIPSDGCVFVGGDWSGAEVRIVSAMSHDQKMIQAYKEGKDLYCAIASMIYKVPYDDCKEFYPDGTTNKEGKERRSVAKKVVLSLLYGKGRRTLAEDLNKPVEEAQRIYDAVMSAYPDLNVFIEQSKVMAQEKGYVTTLFGRKRRLPETRLKQYEFRYSNGRTPTVQAQMRMANELRKYWGEKRKQRIEEYRKDGIIITDNSGYIARALRQCVNARVQGTCADANKILIRLIGEDEVLKQCGFKLCMTIHDEVVGECPIETAGKAKERLNDIMTHCMDEYMEVPMKSDVTCTDRWYGEEVEV